jgi:hypothetical protein
MAAPRLAGRGAVPAMARGAVTASSGRIAFRFIIEVRPVSALRSA